MKRKLQIVVLGSDKDLCTKKQNRIAEEVGELLAKAGAILLTGGLGGVMESASKGAKKAGGMVVSILPSNNKKEANNYCDIVIPTGIGFMRGYILTNSADVIIVIGGGTGTRQEVESAYWNKTPIIALPDSGGTAKTIANRYLDPRKRTKIRSAKNSREAVEKALKLV